MFNATANLLFNGTLETLYMVFLSGLIAMLGGIPLGVLLMTTQRQGILQNRLVNQGMGAITNIVRSIPFIILLVALIPLTRLLIGSSIGTNAAVVPLSIGAIPFVARIVESALMEVSPGLIEAGFAMGARPRQIIKKVLLPEAMPAIINGMTLTLITLVGYSAMAGAVGGGGLGAVAINYGYQRFDTMIMLVTVIILVIIVQLIQFLGDFIVKKLSHV